MASTCQHPVKCMRVEEDPALGGKNIETVLDCKSGFVDSNTCVKVMRHQKDGP